MIQTSTVYFDEILKAIDNRFTPKYFFLLRKFNLLEKRPDIKIKKLGEITKYIISGIYIPKYSKKGTPYLRVGNIKAVELDLNSEDLVYVNEKEIEIPDKIKVKQDDIIIGRTAVLGISSLVNELSENFIISQHLTRFRPMDIPIGYLVAFLNSRLFKEQMEIASYGITRVELTHAQLKEVKVPVGKKSQMKEISNLILSADKAHIGAINKVNQARQIFENEIGINYQNIPDEKTYSVDASDLTDFLTPKFYYPKYLNILKQLKRKFKTIRLGEVADIKKGDEVGSENYKKYIDKKDSDVPFIRTSDLVNYEIDNYPDYYIDEEIYKELNQNLKPNDILFTKDGKIGLTAMATSEDKCILASGIAIIRPIKEIDPFYLFLVLSTKIGLYQFLQRVVIASTIPHLRPERLAEIEIPLIDSRKQNEISKVVKEVFQLKAKKKTLIKEAINKVENLIESK